MSAEAAPSSKIQPAFLPQMPLETWNQYLLDRTVKLGETLLREVGLDFQQVHLEALIRSNELLPLLIDRDGYLQLVPPIEEWQACDRLIYLLHDPKPLLLRRLAGGISRTPLTVEKLPSIEEIPIASLLPEIEEARS